MNITAPQIISWIEQNPRRAQEYFPFLIGQLCNECKDITRIGFPSGDSISRPGFDGIVISGEGNAWVPEGMSVWELGTSPDTWSKAEKDFEKRNLQYSDSKKAKTTFIFFTPRKWNKKDDWEINKKSENSQWLDIRAYDVDDLVQWLEQSPATMIRLLEKINASSRHIESTDFYWQKWAESCDPKITLNSFLLSRDNSADQLKEAVQSQRSITITAESSEESRVFAVAAILSEKSISDRTVVITNQEGWRFVETITNDICVIVAYDYRAQDLCIKDNITLITPIAEAQLSPRMENAIKVSRPEIYDYQKALIAIGLDEANARRTALNTGRSWIVFRRQNSIDGRIIQPEWTENPEARVLPTLCLLGAWDATRHGDKWAYEDVDVVSKIAGHSYEEIERDLTYLASCDDAPVISLNGIWKVKSPSELFLLFSNQMTTDQLDRFFFETERILRESDPQFDLEEDERWLAAIKGKSRLQSPTLLNSLCDSIAKLATLGPEIPRLNSLSVEHKVKQLINNLFENADSIRWLSLSPYLQDLAEAAPDIFLTHVERSLSESTQPIAELVYQSSVRDIRRCSYQAPLLWTLEQIAWDPVYLAKVTRILVQLSLIKTESRSGNTPEISLSQIYCTWRPQTNATALDRIEVLKLFSKEYPDSIVSLLHSLIMTHNPYISPSPRYKWRNEEDQYKVATPEEVNNVERELWEMLIALSSQNISHATRLLEGIHFSHADKPSLDTIMNLMISLKDRASEEEKEVIADILRRKISTHELIHKAEVATPQWTIINKIEEMLSHFTPNDRLLKHKWLFNAWSFPIQGFLPYENSEQYHQKAMEMREEALDAVLSEGGTDLLEELVLLSNTPDTIGATIAHKADFFLIDWIVQQLPDAEPDSKMQKMISGFLRYRHTSTVPETLRQIVSLGTQANWHDSAFVSLFLLAPQSNESWGVLDTLNENIQAKYWEQVSPDYLYHWEVTFDYFVAKMIAARRPRTALNTVHLLIDELPASKLFELLKSAMYVDTDDVPLSFSDYYWEKMLERFECDPSIPEDELVIVELHLLDILNYGQKYPTLFKRYTSDPIFFTEAIDAVYKTDDENRIASTLPERVKRLYRNVICKCNLLPGQSEDSFVDRDKFIKFVDSVFSRSREINKTTGCEAALGYLLVHAPECSDSAWPPDYICEVLEPLGRQALREQFAIGKRNLRGVVGRAYNEGGNKERNLAQKYRSYQEQLKIKFPNVATMLGKMAVCYEGQAKREDQDAELRLEGF